jgi:hypothetical protein
MKTAKFWLISLMLMSLTSIAAAKDGKHTVLVLDDCDPNDKGYGATGGCALKKGDVSLVEFNTFVPLGGLPPGASNLPISKSKPAKH